MKISGQETKKNITGHDKTEIKKHLLLENAFIFLIALLVFLTITH